MSLLFFLFYQLEQEIPEAEVQEPTLMDIDDSLSSMVRDGNKRLYCSSHIPSKLVFHFLGWCFQFFRGVGTTTCRSINPSNPKRKCR